MSETLYKWLNGREATHVSGFRYRLRVWTPPIEGRLVPCKNGYHLMREQDLSHWISRDLFVAEYDGELIEASDKIVVRRARIVEHLKGWNDRTARLFAADCAECMLPIFEARYPDDDRPRKAIQAARDYANGLIGKKECDSAAYSAYSAYSAARAAYSAAYWAADSAAVLAYSAAYWAADSAAVSAYSAAYWAADSSAVSAAREWQSQRILDYAYGRVSANGGTG